MRLEEENAVAAAGWPWGKHASPTMMAVRRIDKQEKPAGGTLHVSSISKNSRAFFSALVHARPAIRALDLKLKRTTWMQGYYAA